MTTLNTIIEEEKKAFDALVTKKVALPVQYGGKSTTMTSESVNLDKIKTFLTTVMQRAFEAGRLEALTPTKEVTEELPTNH